MTTLEIPEYHWK